jgi:hypothetical protein
MSTRKHDVHLYGVGGRTIAKTYYNDLKVVRRKRPDVVFLQVGGFEGFFSHPNSR